MYRILLHFVLLPFIAFVSLYPAMQASEGANFCSDDRSHRSNTVLGPNIKIALTPFRLTDSTMFSVVGEGGSRNSRFSGTYGYFLTRKQHLKFTVEQLNQKMGYNFTSGKTSCWLHQFAIGGVYEYQFCNRLLQSAEIRAAYSHCPGKKLRPHPCCVFDTEMQDVVHRHIAGGNDGFFAVGLTATPWNCGALSLAADYDCVTYNRKIRSRRHLYGFGGTAKLHQRLAWGLALDLKGSFRRPFSYYEGALNWTNEHAYGILTIGLYASYTNGRANLPNSWTSGLLISADFGGIPFFSNCFSCPPSCIRGQPLNPAFPLDRELIAWVSNPAVRMPSVLAVSEQKVYSTDNPCPPPPSPSPSPPPHCEPPKSVTIPTQMSLPFDASAFFDRKGSPMVFSARGLPVGFRIDPVSGIIHGNIFRIGTIFVEVTGTTHCGQTSQIFEIVNPYSPYPYGPYPYNPYGPYVPYVHEEIEIEVEIK